MGPGARPEPPYWEKPSANTSLTVHGNHTYKFGGDMYLQGIPTIPYTNTNGTYAFSANETSLPYLVGVGLSGGSLGFLTQASSWAQSTMLSPRLRSTGRERHNSRSTRRIRGRSRES